MKNSFKEYNPLTQQEINELWENSIFIFDRNVLLNLYRYSEETSKKLIETIESIKKIWIPYQVGLEFYRKRLFVISDQKKSFEEFEKKINDIIYTVEDKNRNPFFSNALLKNLQIIRNDIKNEVNKKKEYYDDLLIKDDLLERINKLFDNKVGVKPSNDELKVVFSDGEKRYKENIPPGFKDSSKQGNEKFGDLIIWKEIIKKSKGDEQDVIFITDDRKEDWWLEHQGRTISPRPELLKEFHDETNKKCHFYKPFQFLEFSNKYLKSNVQDEVIEEVKNYRIIESNVGNYNLFEIILNGSFVNINLFYEELKTAGYNVTLENIEFDLYTFTIILPKIFDLERRLNEKYLNHVSEFNLELVEIIKK